MPNPKLATIPCPTCGEEATVHREARGKRAYYIRCYEADGMTARCGTLQCRGPKGQEYVQKYARGLGVDGQDQAVEEAKEEAAEAASAEVRSERRKRSPLGRLTDVLTTDEPGA